MSKRGIAILVAVIAVLAVGGVVALSNRGDSTKSSSSTSSTRSSDTDTSMDTMDTSTQPTPAPSTTQSQGNAVAIQDFAFSPATLTVKKGTTVTWTNKDSASHTVTSDDDATGEKLDSKVLGNGDSYSMTFTATGTYGYHCALHPNMTAKVIVTE